jgi:hypothetical protein
MNVESLKSQLLSIPGVLGVEVKETKGENVDIYLMLKIKEYSPKLGLQVAKVIGKEVGKCVISNQEIPEIDWDYIEVNREEIVTSTR